MRYMNKRDNYKLRHELRIYVSYELFYPILLTNLDLEDLLIIN